MYLVCILPVFPSVSSSSSNLSPGVGAIFTCITLKRYKNYYFSIYYGSLVLSLLTNTQLLQGKLETDQYTYHFLPSEKSLEVSLKVFTIENTLYYYFI